MTIHESRSSSVAIDLKTEWLLHLKIVFCTRLRNSADIDMSFVLRKVRLAREEEIGVGCCWTICVCTDNRQIEKVENKPANRTLVQTEAVQHDVHR